MKKQLEFLTVDAGIRPGELALLLGASRTAVSRWINGHVEPTAYLQPRIVKLFDAAHSAVEAGELPLPPAPNEHGRLAALGREERQVALNKTLAKFIRQMA